MANEQSPPAFLAVEAAEDTFRAIMLAQRTLLREKITMDEQLCSIPTPLVEEFARTIGYEADANVGILPQDTPIVWLDSFRDLDPTARALNSSFANRYVHFLNNLLPSIADMASSAAVLNAMHSHLMGTSSPDFSRDAKWFDLVMAQTIDQDQYAIIVVGADHIQQTGKYLASLLKQAGICCLPEDLTRLEKCQQEP